MKKSKKATNESLPEGWKQVPLGEILSQEQIQHVLREMQRLSGTELTKALKAYFNGFRAELQAKGYEPDFLAYALPYWVGQSAQQEQERERREAEEMTRKFMRGRQN